jgi:hypothetical protein
MKINCARCASLVLMLTALTSTAWCQDTSRPSLFPMPPMPPVGSGYSVSPANADMVWGPSDPSPVQTGPVQAPLSADYSNAMKGGYDSCTSSVGSPCGGSVCCSSHYVYANALVMSALKPGGYVTSIDDNTFGQRLNYCNREFGNLWAGGFEIGGGMCLGGGCGSCCNRNAIEMVYWGVFPANASIIAQNDVTSMIDFGGLDYNGASANVPYTDAEIQRVAAGWNFNSVEMNLVGNCWNGGPFGCGMCGGCCGNAGSPWGFGYVAGFRYINFHDNFLFSSDPTDNVLDGDADELNYSAAFTNNLFGFQLGAGLSYCVTDCFTAYCISKFGMYNNSVTALQRVYGSAGPVTINNGPYTGEEFSVRTAPRNTFATAGQFDLGGRWAITNNLSANFGYRVLAMAGVATVDANMTKDNFHDVDGIAFTDRNSSFLLHGAFGGLTYCW